MADAPAPNTFDADAPVEAAGHDGRVYVHNPLNGEIKLVTPAEASELVYNRGFTPLSKDDAIRVDSDQILKDSTTPVDSIVQGLGRGVSGGLTDLLPRTPDEERERQAVDQAFPWLTPISEGAGFLAPFGVSAGLSAVGEGVTGALRGGEEIGALGKIATRAAGMGTEGSVYGGIGAAREAQQDNEPLTAQKLMSGMFGGALVGGALGAGTGAAEGAGSMLRGLFKDTSAAREELNAAGLKDSDVVGILEKAGIPHEPGALDKFQALLYNDPNITPEFLAAMKASPGIRDDVMLAAEPQRAAAEADFAKALNDLHEGNQEALRGWSGKLKREQVERWIGSDSEHVSDAGNLVEMMKILDVPGRFNLAKDIVDAVRVAGKSNPEAFNELINSVGARNGEEALRNVDRALLHGNKDVLDQLFSSKLLNDSNIPRAADSAAKDIEVNVAGQRFGEDAGMRKESFDFLRKHPSEANRLGLPRIEIYPDEGPAIGDGRHRMAIAYENGERSIEANVVHYDADGHVISERREHVNLVKNPGDNVSVREVTGPSAQESAGKVRKLLRIPEKVEPAWKSAALDFIDKHLEQLGEVAAQPKGYVAQKGAGDIRKMADLLKGARESIMAGDRANAFGELDFVKKRLGSVRGGGYISTGEGARGIAQAMHEEVRPLLENADLWGAKAAGAQQEMNALLHQRLTRDGDFYRAFYSGAGMPDPNNPWVEKMVADPAKIKSVMNRMVNPENSLELGIFKKHIAESEQLADIMNRYYKLDDGQKAVVDAMRKGSKAADEAMDKAVHFNLRINQGRVLNAAVHGGARGAFGSLAAYALGGPLGLAGATIAKAITNPGRILRMQAIAGRMLGGHGARVADSIASLIGKGGALAARGARSAGRATAGAYLVSQDVEKRQTGYNATLKDLASVASNTDQIVKALASWHGPDLAHMPTAFPQIAAALQRGAQYCLSVAPARPQPGIFSDDQAGLISASEAEEFANTVHAAMDPAETVAMMKDGRLTPQVLKAAETTAPELVDDMRTELSGVLMNTAGTVKFSPLEQQGIALFLGVTPSPHYTLALQTSWDANQTKPSAKVSPGSLGDTGVNERYSSSKFSEADRLESGEIQQ